MKIIPYTSNVFWLDDEDTSVNTTKPILEKIFLEKTKNKLSLSNFKTSKDFIIAFKENHDFLDFIFLDIELNEKNKTGIDVYDDIRNFDKEIIVVFVSGHATDLDIEYKIDKRKQNDPNLFVLAIPFPSKTEINEYSEQILSPIISMGERHKKNVLKTNLDQFYSLSKNGKQRIIQKSYEAKKPIIEKMFLENINITSIMIGGDESDKLICKVFTGKPLNQKVISEFSKLNKKIVYGFNKIGVEDIEFVNLKYFDYFDDPISTECIYAQIIDIEANSILLNCLIDQEKETFQLRMFDKEPIKDTVNMIKNNIISIKIETYKGERKFIFENCSDELKDVFKKKTYFGNPNKDYSSFLNPKTD